jgi:4-hydroxy-2-oxoheptanedioate aldolase
MEVPLPVNRLKQALAEGRAQIGLWSSLASHVSAEVVAGSGFDWLLLDTEHSPNDTPLILSQLQAMSEGTACAVVRPAWNDAVIFKCLLDIGVQSFVVPFVQSAEEARRAVAATRYPPAGIRGIATTTRANRFGRVKNYATRGGGCGPDRGHCRRRRRRWSLHRSERPRRRTRPSRRQRASGRASGDRARGRAHPRDGQMRRHPGAGRNRRAALAGARLSVRWCGQ